MLVPLSELPVRVRAAEERARATMPPDGPAFEIVAAPGTHREDPEYPPVRGEVLTRAAAVAYTSSSVVRIPGTPPYRLFRFREPGSLHGEGI